MISRHLTLLLLSVATFAQAGGVFWTDRGVSQLKRMNFDGSSNQTISLSGAVTSPGSNIRGIAVDVVSNRVFWADNGADRLLRANFDGTGTTILYTIAGGNSFPADVRLDLGSQLFYWCDQLRNRIQRSTLNGANVIDVITNAAPAVGDGPYFMDLDVPAGKIYWGDFNAGAIYRANLDGSGRETLLTGNDQTRGVWVEPKEGMLYWVNRNAGKIHRCPLSAFAGGTIGLTNPAVQTLYTNLDTPHGLVLDIPARKLYWADTGSNMQGVGGRTVSRGDLDGSTPREILVNGSEPWDVDLDRRCTNYTEWVLRCFRKDASPADFDPAADPDHDGIPNSMEYAFDFAPFHADTNGWPQGFLTVGPTQADYHALKFRRRVGTADLTYYVQVSSNLTSWSGSPIDPKTVEVQAQSLGDGMEEVTVRTLYAINGYPTHFMRLRVELSSNVPDKEFFFCCFRIIRADNGEWVEFIDDTRYQAGFGGIDQSGTYTYTRYDKTATLILTPSEGARSAILLSFNSDGWSGSYRVHETAQNGTFVIELEPQ